MKTTIIHRHLQPNSNVYMPSKLFNKFLTKNDYVIQNKFKTILVN